MKTKRKPMLVSLLALVIALSCVIAGTAFASERSANAQTDAVYYNLITNGDFETEFESNWGGLNAPIERIEEPGNETNHVGKATSLNDLRSRVWHTAASMYDQLYKVSFRVKFVNEETPDGVTNGELLAGVEMRDVNGAYLTTATGSAVADWAVGVNSVQLNTWVTVTYYLKIVDNRNGTYNLLLDSKLPFGSGAFPKNIKDIQGELVHFDFRLGGGPSNATECYLDDYTVIPYGEYANAVENGDFEADLPQGGWGIWNVISDRVPENDNPYAATDGEEAVNAALEGESDVVDNYVGRTQNNEVRYRIWNADSMRGGIYKISFRVKLTSEDRNATVTQGGYISSGIGMASEGQDAFDIVPNYTTIPGLVPDGSTLDEWHTVTYYLKMPNKSDGTWDVYMGKTLQSLEKKNSAAVTAKLRFIDLIIYCDKGNIKYWYLDDVSVVEQPDSLITNSDMSDEFGEHWGMNSFGTVSHERYYDEAKQSYVAKQVGGGWVKARLTANQIDIGKLYRINVQLRVDSDTATCATQQVIQFNDAYNIFITTPNTYAVNVYNSFVGYFKFELQADNSVVMLTGLSKNSLTASGLKYDTIEDFSFIDVAVGSGTDAAWYVDNFTVVCVSPDEYNGEITVTVPEPIVITGVKDGAIYELGEDSVVPEFNVGTATLAKDDGEAKNFESGTEIKETGSYVLAVTSVGETKTVSFTVKSTTKAALELYTEEIAFGKGYTFNDNLALTNVGNVYTVAGEVTEQDLTEWGFKSGTNKAIAFKLTIPNAGEDVSIKLSGGADEPKDLGIESFDGDDFIYLVLDATQSEFTVECKATEEKEPITIIIKIAVESDEEVTTNPDDTTDTDNADNSESVEITVTGVVDGGSYLIGAGTIAPEFNVGTATLKKDEEEEAFISGTEITEAGNYTLKVTNGEETFTVNFTVVDFSVKLISGKAEIKKEGNKVIVNNADGIVKVEISAEGYVTRTVTLTPDNNTQVIELVPKAQAFEAEITVLDGNGKPLEGFTFEIPAEYDGLYGETIITDNILSILDVVDEIEITVKKNLYADVVVTINKFQKTATVRLIAREIVTDNTDYTTELYGYDSFEKLELTSNPDAMLTGTLVTTFVNGGGATIEVTDVDSHYGEKSLKVHSVGDRFVSRLIGALEGQQNMFADRTYHVTWWLKGITENLKIQPRAYVAYFVEGQPLNHGSDHNIGVIDLGEEITLSSTAWTKLEAEFGYSVRDGKLYINVNGKETEYASSVDGKQIIELYLFDLSLDARGDYYVDDITFFNTYSATVEVLDGNGDRVTEDVTFTVKDFCGETVAIEPTVDATEKLFKFENLAGRYIIQAVYDGKDYDGLVSATYPNLTLAEEYDAFVKFTDGAGNAIAHKDIKEAFAFDGAIRVTGEWLEEKGVYKFGKVMGDLKVYAYVAGYEQHEYQIVTRKNPNAVFALKKIASSNDGMPGNLVLNGDVERLDQLAMFNNTQYALEGVTTNGENKWASFQPVLTLSDEAAVGEKSLRISTDTTKLCADDPEYAAFMEENDLGHGLFGDRVAYRAGNGFLLDGSEYVFTTFLKAPATQGTSTTFNYIFLAPINLCNGGQFNFWADPTITVDGDCWHKMEIYYSFNLAEDKAAAESGKYEFERYAFVCKVRYVLDGEVVASYHGIYDYNAYKDGVYAFYRPGTDGEMTGFNGLDTERHDGIDGQEGGRSFGSIAMFEPSLQIHNGDSLLVDGGYIVRAYTAEIKVNNRDLTPNANVDWFRFTDLFTGEISYVAAGEYYDDIDQVYYIPELFNAYSVAVCDADKNLIDGLVAQTVSSEAPRTVIEYSYDITLTLKDQDGNMLTDIVVRIVLANGSYAEAINNGDGTYSYAGLSGERTIQFRKASGSENSYSFPSGITVSSSNTTLTVTITRNSGGNTEDPGDPGEDPKPAGKKKCGCGSFASAGSVAAALVLLGAMCCVVFVGKKRQQNR